jgi:hypothetical protein
VAAFIVHGLTDAGWGITSIALLLLTVLALLSPPPQDLGNTTDSLSDSAPRSALQWPWLIVSLLCGLASAGAQRAVLAEDLRTESRESMSKQAAQAALEKATAATEADPLSARIWLNRAVIEEANRENPRFGYVQAQRRQPTRATHLLNMAEAQAEKAIEFDVPAGVLFDQAVALEPNETKTRLARGQWLLSHNDARGWQDLEYIARLADQPYGKYPATPDIVNLDFAQAYAKLAARAMKEGKRTEAARLVERGLYDVARWHAYEPHRRELAEATGTLDELDHEKQLLETLEAQLNRLRNQLKEQSR